MGRGGDLLAMAPILTMYLEVGGCVLDAMLLAQPQAGLDAVGVVRLQVEVVEDIVRL